MTVIGIVAAGITALVGVCYTVIFKTLVYTLPSGFFSRGVSHLLGIPADNRIKRYFIALVFTAGLYLVGRWSGVTEDDVVKIIDEKGWYPTFIMYGVLSLWGQFPVYLASLFANTWMTPLLSVGEL